MRAFLVATSVLFATLLPAAAADAQAPSEVASPAAPAAAPAPSPAAPSPLDEAFQLVDAGPHNIETLTRAIKLYEEHLDAPGLDAKRRADGYADLVRAYLRRGDEKPTLDQKLADYGRGRAVAKRGFAFAPRHADLLFWDLACLASTGREKGIMNSLFMLGDLRAGLQKVLEIEPGHRYARQTLGEIDHAVPGIAGGSDKRAEAAFLEVLKRDPRFTPSMMQLAKLYRDQGKKEEARAWAKKALAGPSSVENDWRKFDRDDAKKVLRELGD